MFNDRQRAFLRELQGSPQWREILDVLEENTPAVRSWRRRDKDVASSEQYAYMSGQHDQHMLVLLLLGNRTSNYGNQDDRDG